MTPLRCRPWFNDFLRFFLDHSSNILWYIEIGGGGGWEKMLKLLEYYKNKSILGVAKNSNMKWTINPDSPAPTGLCEYVYVNMLKQRKNRN